MTEALDAPSISQVAVALSRKPNSDEAPRITATGRGAVAEQIVHSPVRSPAEVQRPSHGARIGMRHPKLTRVLEQMEERIENPVSPSQLARETGLSTRQLERLFRRYLGRSPKRYYLELRLKQARNFLLQTDMSVIEVAVACGFTSASHFSKCYRGFFATTPYRERGIPTRET